MRRAGLSTTVRAFAAPECTWSDAGKSPGRRKKRAQDRKRLLTAGSHIFAHDCARIHPLTSSNRRAYSSVARSTTPSKNARVAWSWRCAVIRDTSERE